MQLFWIQPCWLPTYINIERPIKASNARMYCRSFISVFGKCPCNPLRSGLEFEVCISTGNYSALQIHTTLQRFGVTDSFLH